MEALELRGAMLQRLREDLIGPFRKDEVFEPDSGGKPTYPSNVYLTGMLWPPNTGFAPEEDIKLSNDGGTAAEVESVANEDEQSPFETWRRPGSCGISFAVVAQENPVLDMHVSFAMYVPEILEQKDSDKKKESWRRREFNIIKKNVLLDKDHENIKLDEEGLPEGIYIHARKAKIDESLTDGKNAFLVSVMLVNATNPGEEKDSGKMESLTLFQTEIVVRPAAGTRLIARPSQRANVDMEDKSLNLLYRDTKIFATGHTCSARWEVNEENPDEAILVASTWLPAWEVRVMDAKGHPLMAREFEKGKNVLSALNLAKASNSELEDLLCRLPKAYKAWLETGAARAAALEDEDCCATAAEHQRICENVMARMKRGAETIAKNPCLAEAFRMANRAILMQYRWKENNPDAEMHWRPFQLGFILLAAASTMLDENSSEEALKEREIMDLLWFPTGGGKTEAYLGLVAMLLFQRCLRNGNNPDKGAGVAAIMRYTLRLLTTQQFARAAALILACEMLRQKDEKKFGTEPFSIGLWIGNDSTPNRLDDARKILENPAIGGQDGATPIQLIDCPACHQPLKWEYDNGVKATCLNADCVLSKLERLPVWTVDEEIYEKKPSLLIGTVDKFAQLVRKPETNALFGVGENPPDLIIQDELHLISGPLGSICGLYEVLIDKMFARGDIPVKIIGSTATIRKAPDQIHALYNRKAEQFPPAYLDANDSGFAVLKKDSPGRIYCGVSSGGKSGRYSLGSIAASLLLSVHALAQDGNNDMDGWSTLVGYFNSLRELGGALVLFQDDVREKMGLLKQWRGEKSVRSLDEIRELTSRLHAKEVVEILADLEIPAGLPGSIDAVLASNMLGVGVDISRLGLMVVNGQPKSMAEYIQATSRVGRGASPGLVVTLFNHLKARDRSHFENFSTIHQSLYRDVEATSVTPFAPRARDKALHAVLVGLVRHIAPGMVDDPDLSNVSEEKLAEISEYIANRAQQIDSGETNVANELKEKMTDWLNRSPDTYWKEPKSVAPLLTAAEDAASYKATGGYKGKAWATPNSMRTVEPGVPFRLID